MRSRISNQVRIALVALAALAPLTAESASAQFFHGGEAIGASGGQWRNGDGGVERPGSGPGARFGRLDLPVYVVLPRNLPANSAPQTPIGGQRPPVHPAPRPTLGRAGAPHPLAASRAALPPAGETRFRAGEVLAEIPFTIPEARVTAILRRHRLTQIDAVSVGLLGLSLRRWRTADARSATAIVSELGSESALARVQPNYLFKPATEAPAVAPVKATLTAEQYALVKMKVAPSLENPDSAPIRVAVIDTDIDDSHRDLKGVVAERFDAIGEGRPVRLRKHGTEMAGGIAADGQLRGVATRVKILSARAFDGDDSGEARGTTLSIVKALDWSAEKKAQVVNMSFAGPQDPAMHDALARAYALGIALVGAAGNMGPTGPAQYPGADPNVIAATATDENDRLFSHANVGAYVAIAAPGVDVLLPAPDDDYAMESGTSVSCALVTGVVALILEHQPRLGPADIRQRLTATAEPIGGGARSNEFGAGLVDAAKAVAR